MSQPRFIEHIFLLKFNFVIKDGKIPTTLNFEQMNLWCKSMNLPLYIFQADESLQCASHRISPCISNKQIFSVIVTELDFVFYNKTGKGISKNVKNRLTLKIFLYILVSSLYSYF